MISALQRVFQIKELKDKLTFTALMLIVCRIGGFVPIPGINGEIVVSYFKHIAGGGQNFFQLIDIFSGGAFSQMTIIALGVVPYISASIAMQMLTPMIPSIQRDMKDNPTAGRQKVNRYTRFLTVCIALFHSSIYARYAVHMNQVEPGIIVGDLLSFQLFDMPILFYMVTVITMTTGSLFLMWIGEQITEKGIGNGVSLIISIGILSSLPSAFGMIIQQLNLDTQEAGQMNLASCAVLLTTFVLVTIGTILILQGHRRIPLQVARRMVGIRERQESSSYVPLKLSYAGVIPVIFASTFLMFPQTIISFIGTGEWTSKISSYLTAGSAFYMLLYVSLIIFFTYFWTSMSFKPDQIASDLKKNGAFIPGVRQGKPTQDYLDTTMRKITFLGAISLALIAIMPQIFGKLLGIPQNISYFFGGTTLLILVGVVLDTMKQIESHLLAKRYDGFMTKGRVRGR